MKVWGKLDRFEPSFAYLGQLEQSARLQPITMRRGYVPPIAWVVYPVFHVISHSPFGPMSYRTGVKLCLELIFRKSPLPDFGNSSIVVTALRRN